MEFTRCFRCMKEAASYPCPHCGYAPEEDWSKDYVLRPGTILNGKYVAGTPLGQGGFGITYIGWDLALDCKVAIKEYYPSGQVVRDNGSGSVLHWLSTPQSEAARDMGTEMFLKEARKMTRVRNIPQVVHVHDLFQENDTAYIVMDFVEGQTLKAHLAKTGPLSWEDTKKIFLPAIRAMEQVHQAGLVHRDLSPDNLMLLPDSSVQILDLGAAKDLNVNSGASSMQVAKSGFSPLEQYSQRGGSGPWTDVYAMAATMYFTLTGVVPPNAVDRVDEDPIHWDLPQLAALPKGVLPALKQALAVSAKARTQSMGEFLSQLETATPGPAPTPHPGKKVLLAAIAAVLVVAILTGWLLRGTTTSKQDTPSQTFSQGMDTMPSPVSTEETVPATDETEGILPTASTEAATLPPEPTEATEPESTHYLPITAQTISAGRDHTVAIKRDGSAVATGSNEHVQCDLSGWTDIVAVSAGYKHTVGLKADGTVVAAGSDVYGQCNVSGWKDIVAISSKNFHTVGLKADGTVVSTQMGDTEYNLGQCDVSDWTDIVAISTGDFHTVGLKADGTAVSVGCTDDNRCNVSGWKDIVAISSGSYHTVGLKADGTVVATGVNDDGRCDVSGWNNIVAISAGLWHTAGLKADGTVVTTGDNHCSQCNVSGWNNIVAISAGNYHTIGLKADGTIVSTEVTDTDKDRGQDDVSNWTDIRIPQKAQTISAGVYHTVAVKRDGSAVGIGANDERSDVSDWTDLVAISASFHTAGLKADGTVVAIGDNHCGRCDVSDWTDIIAIGTGINHTVGLKADGTVVATQIADSTADYKQCNVSDWTDIIAISAGGFHTVGLKADGTVVATGYNDDGRCNVSTWKNIVAISAGWDHTVGLKADGTVIAIGNYDNNRCNVSSWRNIVAIAAGNYHTVGLKADGTVVATGLNDCGQCNVSGWKDIIAISAGNYHTIGLKADGTIVSTEITNAEYDAGQDNVSGWTDIRIPGTIR